MLDQNIYNYYIPIETPTNKCKYQFPHKYPTYETISIKIKSEKNAGINLKLKFHNCEIFEDNH